MKIEIDHIKQSNARYVEESHDIQSQIEALNRHVALLTQQNYEVNIWKFNIFLVICWIRKVHRDWWSR